MPVPSTVGRHAIRRVKKNSMLNKDRKESLHKIQSFYMAIPSFNSFRIDLYVPHVTWMDLSPEWKKGDSFRGNGKEGIPYFLLLVVLDGVVGGSGGGAAATGGRGCGGGAGGLALQLAVLGLRRHSSTLTTFLERIKKQWRRLSCTLRVRKITVMQAFIFLGPKKMWKKKNRFKKAPRWRIIIIESSSCAPNSMQWSLAVFNVLGKFSVACGRGSDISAAAFGWDQESATAMGHGERRPSLGFRNLGPRKIVNREKLFHTAKFSEDCLWVHMAKEVKAHRMGQSEYGGSGMEGHVARVEGFARVAHLLRLVTLWIKQGCGYGHLILLGENLLLVTWRLPK